MEIPEKYVFAPCMQRRLNLLRTAVYISKLTEWLSCCVGWLVRQDVGGADPPYGFRGGGG